MHAYALDHLSDDVLMRGLVALIAQDRRTTASVLAHIAEIDARRLYAPAGYPSMHAYCIGALGLSEDAAYKRIQAARAARRFPALFEAIAEGKVHLSGVCLLAPCLSEANVDELLEEAVGRRKSEIEEMLARRLSQARSGPAVIRPVAAAPFRTLELAPGQVEGDSASGAGAGNNDELAPGQVDHPRNQGTPLSLERFLVQVTVGACTFEKLRHAQALLSHSVPSGDVAQVLDRALDALISALEKRKLGATGSKRKALPNFKVGGRYVPVPVRRAVWERDGGQCSFVSASGRRCQARRFLEFDHVDPVARGGEATVERVRLRCRTHNQYEAERIFGEEFMRTKREVARHAAAERQLLTGLRHLGFRANEAHRAAEHARRIQGATLEEQFRVALQFLGREKVHGHRSPG